MIKFKHEPASNFYGGLAFIAAFIGVSIWDFEFFFILLPLILICAYGTIGTWRLECEVQGVFEKHWTQKIYEKTGRRIFWSLVILSFILAHYRIYILTTLGIGQ